MLLVAFQVFIATGTGVGAGAASKNSFRSSFGGSLKPSECIFRDEQTAKVSLISSSEEKALRYKKSSKI